MTDSQTVELARKPTRIGVAILAAVVLAVVAMVATSRSDGDELVTPATTSTSPVTVPAGAPPVVGVAIVNDRVFVFGTHAEGVMGATAAPDLDLGFDTPAIAIDDRLVVLDPAGAALVGREGEPFREIACCYDDLLTSDERGRFWAIEGRARAELIEIDDASTDTQIDLEGQPVLGSMHLGLVTVDGAGRPIWRRPDVDAHTIEIDDDLEPLASGGDVIVVLDAARDLVEVRLVTDGSLVTVLRTAEGDRRAGLTATVSTAGDAVALTADSTTTVFDITDGQMIGTIDGADDVVAIGSRRFAAVVDGEIVTSDGTPHDLAASVRVIAVRSELR